MKSRFPTVLVLLLATVAELTLAQNKMTNIDYLAMGYNIYRGNPLASVVDPGFTITKIFSFDYSSGEITSDGRYYVPVGVSLSTKNGCNLDFSSTTVTGMDSYTNSLKQSVESSVGYAGGEFSASVDYKTVSTTTTNSKMIYIVSTGECLVYTSKLDDYFPPKLSQNFQSAALTNLPDNYDQTSYFRFIENYGTHYVSQIDMGARMSFISSLTQEGWQSLESQGVSVTTAAKYSGEISVGVKSSTETQKDEAHQFDMTVEETKVSSIGKAPTNGDLFAWAQASTNEPMPVEYTVSPLSDLFIPSYFDVSASATRLANIKRNMEKALTTGEYCSYLKSRGIVSSCSLPPPDQGLPPIINSCRFCAKTCGGLYPVASGGMSMDQNWPNFFFDYPAGCSDAPYAHNPIKGGGARLCCMKEDDKKKGSCRLCTSCGGTYSYSSGSMMNDQNWPNWITAFGDSCLSDARSRSPASGRGISLCCNQPKMCSFCSTCGGDFEYETGVIGADQKWPNFFRARGAQCGGAVTTVSYKDGIKLCCNSPGPQY